MEGIVSHAQSRFLHIRVNHLILTNDKYYKLLSIIIREFEKDLNGYDPDVNLFTTTE